MAWLGLIALSAAVAGAWLLLFTSVDRVHEHPLRFGVSLGQRVL
jgi:hypothetical protein